MPGSDPDTIGRIQQAITKIESVHRNTPMWAQQKLREPQTVEGNIRLDKAEVLFYVKTTIRLPGVKAFLQRHADYLNETLPKLQAGDLLYLRVVAGLEKARACHDMLKQREEANMAWVASMPAKGKAYIQQQLNEGIPESSRAIADRAKNKDDLDSLGLEDMKI